jgi:ATP-dependent DNA helicase RecG
VNSSPPRLDASVGELAGAGPIRVEALAARGIRTLRDLLFLLPRRFRERPATSTIEHVLDSRAAPPNERFVIVGRVDSARSGRRRSPARFLLTDPTGSLEALVFGLRAIPAALRRGNEIELEGRVDRSRGAPRLVADHYAASADRSADGAPEPIYDLPAEIPPRVHARWIRGLLPRAAELGDDLDHATRTRLRLPAIADAIRLAHAPSSRAEYEPARRRFAYLELLEFVAPLRQRREALGRFHKRRRIVADCDELLGRLPFAATTDQRAALAAILADLERSAPMHRLLHGEVGSGKTCVALLALLAVVRAGHVAVLLAPTAVLASQHAVVARELFGPDSSRVVVLTRDTPLAESREIARLLAERVPTLVVCTVRVLSMLPPVAFAVIDEQQRFGVSQRARLRADPATDLLVMTATPIPRTLSLVAYGDLDLTTIRELPRGRRPVETTIVEGVDEAVAHDTIRSSLEAGGRVYVICPQIDGDSVATVESVARRLRREFGRRAVAVAHGRRSDSEVAAALAAFRGGEAAVLVSTVLVEVGIDVPAATLIVVLDAERFGLSQLHQLRGRVGRGECAGRCLLVTSRRDQVAIARLEALCRARSGFEVAEADLAHRGAGRVLGVEQHGDIELRHASLVADIDLLDFALRADSVREGVANPPVSPADLVAFGPG